MKTDSNVVLNWKRDSTGDYIGKPFGLSDDNARLLGRYFVISKWDEGVFHLNHNGKPICKGSLKICKGFAQDRVNEAFYAAASVEQMGDPVEADQYEKNLAAAVAEAKDVVEKLLKAIAKRRGVDWGDVQLELAKAAGLAIPS